MRAHQCPPVLLSLYICIDTLSVIFSLEFPEEGGGIVLSSSSEYDALYPMIIIWK